MQQMEWNKNTPLIFFTKGKNCNKCSGTKITYIRKELQQMEWNKNTLLNFFTWNETKILHNFLYIRKELQQMERNKSTPLIFFTKGKNCNKCSGTKITNFFYIRKELQQMEWNKNTLLNFLQKERIATNRAEQIYSTKFFTWNGTKILHYIFLY